MPFKADNQEKKLNAWEVPGIVAYYNIYRLIHTVANYFTEDNMPADGNMLVVGQNDAVTAEQDEMLKNVEGYSAQAGKIIPDNIAVEIHGMVGQDKYIKYVFDEQKKFAVALEKEKNKRGDERIRRFYGDMAAITDPDNGNFLYAVMSNPYAFTFFSDLVSEPTPKGQSSAMQKASLGVPCYEAHYDYTHAVADEIKTDYIRQKYEMAGWPGVTRYDYLNQLYSTHQQFLAASDNLRQFRDDRQGRFWQIYGNSLAEKYGRGNFARNITPYIGSVRGEARAIENGWKADELAILGVIGSIGESLQRIENFGTEQEKKGLAEYKADFLKLKVECYSLQVNGIADKKTISDRVKAFIETHNSTVAKKCSTEIIFSKKIIDRAFDTIDARYEEYKRNNYQEVNEKLDNPVKYLKDIRSAVEHTGDYSFYVNELLQLGTKEKLNKNSELREYIESIRTENGPEADKIKEALNNKLSKNDEIIKEASEDMAAAIRAGVIQVDPRVEKIKKDYIASKRIANGMMRDSDLIKQRELCYGILGKAQPKNEYDANMSDYGNIAFVKNDNLNGESDNEMMLSSLRVTISKTNEYMTKFQAIKAEAVAKYNELNELRGAKTTAYYRKKNGQLFWSDAKHTIPVDASKSNSVAFMNMFNALEDVKNLNDSSTPQEINRAITMYATFSVAYENKINNQTFAAYSTNGKARLNFSKGAQNDAKRWKQELDEAGLGVVCPTEKVAEQCNRAQNNYNALNNRIINENHINELTGKMESLSNGLSYIENHGLDENKKNIESNLAKAIACKMAILGFEKYIEQNVSINVDIDKDSKQIVESEGFKKMIAGVDSPEKFKQLCDSAKGDCKLLMDTYIKSVKVDEPAKKSEDMQKEKPVKENILIN